jgi:hypothetical protein
MKVQGQVRPIRYFRSELIAIPARQTDMLLQFGAYGKASQQPLRLRAIPLGFEARNEL